MVQVDKPKPTKIAVVLVKRTTAIFIGAKKGEFDRFLPIGHCFCPDIGKAIDAIAKMSRKSASTKTATAPSLGAVAVFNSTKSGCFHHSRPPWHLMFLA